jgi:hypothetical protein
MKVLDKRKAVSTIVATILMINIAIGMGALYFLWTSGLMTTAMGRAQTQYGLLEESRDEAIVIENAWLFWNGTRMRIFVRNVGIRQAVVQAVYVNGTSVSTSPALPRTIYVSGNVTFLISFVTPYNPRYVQSITVATAGGNQAKGEWVAQ